tara:strand:+ start:637 stop:1284 length:648 start_codon:yes stop_codon:yes gene_type:complete
MSRLLLILGIGFLLAACSKEEIAPYPCLDGDCDALFFIDEQVQPNAYQDGNGYWHIEFYGPKYFTIRGELDQLVDHYVINDVPLIEVGYDSDYWVAFNNITFTVPTYSFLGWFTGGGFNNPVPIDDLEYTLTDIAQIQPPLNIAGYQIQKNFCWECPYAPTLLGTYSKYNYTPRQQFYLDNEMVGDTLKVFTKTIFNSDVGESVKIEKMFNIIVN